MTRPTIIAGNWKLNPPRREGELLFQELTQGLTRRGVLPRGVRILVIPPYPFLGVLSVLDAPIELAAQDVSTRGWGAYTGEVGAELLRDFGVRGILVGHSERRHLFAETDEEVGQKAKIAVSVGLTPIICVGETEWERDSKETFDVVERQLRVALSGVPEHAEFVLAYEPVWAIGTGRTATPEQAAEVHTFLRRCLETTRGPDAARETPILYGGSVKPDNAEAIVTDSDIDGVLVGGASLTSASFLEIIDGVIRGKVVSSEGTARN